MMPKSILEVTRYHRPLSLEEYGLIKVITNLCNHRQMLGLILRCNFQTDLVSRLCVRKGKKWEAVKAKANELISQLGITVILERKILDLLWPMCYRILLWRSKYAPSISIRFLERFYWTDRGRIDNARTAQNIIGNKNISVRKRFALACSGFLMPEVHEIWKELSTKDKAYFSIPNDDQISPLLQLKAFALERGPHGILLNTGAFGVFRLLSSRALQCAAKVGLMEVFKHIFDASAEDMKKLMAPAAIEILVTELFDRHFLEEDQNDIGCFLFFEQSECYQTIRFSEDTSLIVSLLLNSSEYKLCLGLLEERLGSLSDLDLSQILRMIFYTYHLEVLGDAACGELFIEIWRKIPFSRRDSLKDSSMAAEFLCLLIKDNFPFLLEKYAFRKKSNFTFLDSKSRTSVNPADFNKWNFLHFLIHEEVLTIPFLKKYRGDVLPLLELKLNTRVTWKRVLRFVSNAARKNPNQKD